MYSEDSNAQGTSSRPWPPGTQVKIDIDGPKQARNGLRTRYDGPVTGSL